MKSFKITVLGLLVSGLMITSGHAQTPEELALAQVFFDTYDVDGDTRLSHSEFVEGFIDQSIADRPSQTRLAMLLFGRKRIESCLGLGFDRTDENGDGLMALEELSEAYARDAFADLGEMC